ncbi:hypothetical protein HPP92_001096 [Vanilla planifolia]|uniref:VQ domain-containing protein n=1 Tax=Vanilla planifolia TaxID=51239 RepID=A0A835VGR0_VANPL|nr:hypothetical protein HPP92_001096 [Vanilla planifolia]
MGLCSTVPIAPILAPFSLLLYSVFSSESNTSLHVDGPLRASDGKTILKKKSQLNGPRPSPLKLNKASHKIGKHPSAVPQRDQSRPPVIIYAVSPKVIHTNPAEFMSLVQRLTGCSSSEDVGKTNTGVGGARVSRPLQRASTEAMVLRWDRGENREMERALSYLLSPPFGGTAALGSNQLSPSVMDFMDLLQHEVSLAAYYGRK